MKSSFTLFFPCLVPSCFHQVYFHLENSMRERERERNKRKRMNFKTRLTGGGGENCFFSFLRSFLFPCTAKTFVREKMTTLLGLPAYARTHCSYTQFVRTIDARRQRKPSWRKVVRCCGRWERKTGRKHKEKEEKSLSLAGIVRIFSSVRNFSRQTPRTFFRPPSPESEREKVKIIIAAGGKFGKRFFSFVSFFPERPRASVFFVSNYLHRWLHCAGTSI